MSNCLDYSIRIVCSNYGIENDLELSAFLRRAMRDNEFKISLHVADDILSCAERSTPNEPLQSLNVNSFIFNNCLCSLVHEKICFLNELRVNYL